MLVRVMSGQVWLFQVMSGCFSLVQFMSCYVRFSGWLRLVQVSLG